MICLVIGSEIRFAPDSAVAPTQPAPAANADQSEIAIPQQRLRCRSQRAVLPAGKPPR